MQFDEVDYSTYDLLVLPGGLGGVERLAAHVGYSKRWRILMHKKNGSVRLLAAVVLKRVY